MGLLLNVLKIYPLVRVRRQGYFSKQFENRPLFAKSVEHPPIHFFKTATNLEGFQSFRIQPGCKMPSQTQNPGTWILEPGLRDGRPGQPGPDARAAF